MFDMFKSPHQETPTEVTTLTTTIESPVEQPGHNLAVELSRITSRQNIVVEGDTVVSVEGTAVGDNHKTVAFQKEISGHYNSELTDRGLKVTKK